jgi:tetratricopeptide (TPR) repeat protein
MLDHSNEAIAEFDKAIALKNDYSLAYMNKGNVLRKMGLYETAHLEYDNAIYYNNEFREAFFNKGLAYSN